MTIAPTRFRHGRLYLTFRCNAHCGYCNVWQDPVFDGHQELTADGIRRCLDELAELGVTYLDLTGGEPALHRELAVAIRHAHQLGMAVDLTTNAIRFPPQVRELVPLVSTMNISLDTLSAERYHRIRGTDTLDRTLGLVESLRADRVDNLKLICVVSRQNVEELDSVVAFAGEQRVPVYLSPMFSYFANQGEVRPAGSVRALKLAAINGVPASDSGPPPDGPAVSDPALLHRVAAQRYQPQALVNLAFLHHLRTLDPSTVTGCGANSRILTIGPDGRVMLPCYHEWDASLAWERPYRELVGDPELVRVRDQEVGQRPGCRSCAVYPYLGLAMSHQLTTPFLLQAYSEELIKLKRYAGELTAGHQRRLLDRGDTVTDQITRRSAPLRAGHHLDELYHFEAADGRVRTDHATEPVSVEELLADHTHDDCWRVQRAPHRIVRLLYGEILPALSRSRPAPEDAPRDGPWPGSGSGSGSGSGDTLLVEALDRQLDCWELLLGLLPEDGAAAGTPSRNRALDDGAPADRLARWCARAGEQLRGGPAASALAVLAAYSSLPAADIAAFGSPREHGEELLTVKLLRVLAGPERRRELAPLFSPELSPVLAPDLAPDLAQVGDAAAGPTPEPYPLAGRGPVPSPEEARSGVRLTRFVAALRRADTEGLRTAVRRWKAAADPDTAVDIERRLLRAELGLPPLPGETRPPLPIGSRGDG